MARYKGDPRWMTARFDGKCSRCDQVVKAGERIFYYPDGRVTLASACGHADEASRDFQAHRQDEEGY